MLPCAMQYCNSAPSDVNNYSCILCNIILRNEIEIDNFLYTELLITHSHVLLYSLGFLMCSSRTGAKHVCPLPTIGLTALIIK